MDTSKNRKILLNPGPVVLSQRVRQALMLPDLCHREPEFYALQQRIRASLLAVYGLSATHWTNALLTGSGTAAVEAMLCSLLPTQGKLLIVENGVYGERMSLIAQIHGIPYHRLRHDWLEKIDLHRLETALKRDPAITHLALVHHETTTGRLNDLLPIANICQARGIPLLLDAVSSFGAERIDFTEWGIAAAAATANKCLHGIPGCAFVILHKPSLPEQKNAPIHSLYLNLRDYLEQQDNDGTPFTQSVHSFYALAEALAEFSQQGGLEHRRRTYWDRMERVRTGLEKLGIKPLLPKDECSSVLNSFHLPKGISYKKLHDYLKECGFIIYAGQGELAKSLFRISCMGEISNDDLDRLLAACQSLPGEAL
ncbi:MAG: 2-aminoethylphosphonate aminotransferase [Candidatus Eutrophobiaceae bacterium]